MRKLLVAILCCSMVFSSCTMVFAEETAVATEDVIEAAGITVDDLEAVALYYKNLSESGEADEYETEYRFALAAAEFGSCEAMLWLGELYQGDKVEAAHEEEDPVAVAIEWWLKAVENDQPRGYTNIGLLYEHKSVPGGGEAYGNIEYSEETAFEYYLMGSDAGDMKAPRYIGLCYQDGIGVEADEEMAFEYFKLAAERGDSTGLVYYANYLLEGRGCEQDVDAAIALYQEIVDTNGHDLVLCALTLGSIYKNGEYVEADTEKAAEYYQIVLDNAMEGSSSATEAQEALDEING